MVCCVGENTLLARNRKPKDLVIEEQFTFLEDKLEKTARQITKFAMMATVISIVTQLLFLLGMCLTTESELFSNDTLLKVSKIVIVGVVLMIVAIPEGLPLAVSIAMALSINSLKKDEILIKNLESVQTCAMLHDVCVSKTGTITKGKMSVVRYHFGDSESVDKNDTESNPLYFKKSDVLPAWKELINEAIIANTDVRIEVNDELCEYEPCGSALEVGMIKFMMENEEDVQTKFINRNQNAPKLVQLPFDQNLKRKVVIRPIVNQRGMVRIYVKGAPEYLIELCSLKISSNSEPKAFDPDSKNQVLNVIVSDGMAKLGLKVLTYAYKDMTYDEFSGIGDDQESPEFREIIERELTYIGTFALEDPLRPNIEESIQYIKYGQLENVGDQVDGTQVHIRMITGDHLETAKNIALRAGIITNEQLQITGTAMTGEQFREKIGHYTKIQESNQQWKVVFNQPKQFDDIKKRLQIIARATAEDKFLLVAGIK